MNLNAKCTDDVQLDGAAIDQTEKPDTSLWSDWMVCDNLIEKTRSLWHYLFVLLKVKKKATDVVSFCMPVQQEVS